LAFSLDFPQWQPWEQKIWDEWLATSKKYQKELEGFHNRGYIEARNRFIDSHAAHWGNLKLG